MTTRGEVTFRVVGVPVEQGSKSLIPAHGLAPARMFEAKAKTLRPWQYAVAAAAMETRPDDWDCDGAFTLRLTFGYLKPKSYAARIVRKVTTPDLDKLCRAVLDSLTGILYVDDRQVDGIEARKVYGYEPGVVVTVVRWPLDEEVA